MRKSKAHTTHKLALLLGKTTRELNDELLALGYQEYRDKDWHLTEEGGAYGRVLSGKAYSTSKAYSFIVWDEAVLKVLPSAANTDVDTRFAPDGVKGRLARLEKLVLDLQTEVQNLKKEKAQ